MATKGFFKKIQRQSSDPIQKATDLLDRLNKGHSVRIPDGVEVRQEGNQIVVVVKNKNPEVPRND